jgi:hypothetical protein
VAPFAALSGGVDRQAAPFAKVCCIPAVFARDITADDAVANPSAPLFIQSVQIGSVTANVTTVRLEYENTV